MTKPDNPAIRKDNNDGHHWLLFQFNRKIHHRTRCGKHSIWLKKCVRLHEVLFPGEIHPVQEERYMSSFSESVQDKRRQVMLSHVGVWRFASPSVRFGSVQQKTSVGFGFFLVFYFYFFIKVFILTIWINDSLFINELWFNSCKILIAYYLFANWHILTHVI